MHRKQILFISVAAVIVGFSAGVVLSRASSSAEAQHSTHDPDHAETLAAFEDRTPSFLTSFIARFSHAFEGRAARAFREHAQKYSVDIPLEIINEYYPALGPDTILAILEEDPYCHTKGHNVGRVIFDTVGELPAALAIATNRCANGAFHGVLMGAYESLAREDGYLDPDEVARFSVGLCDSPELLATAGRGSCFHGVGHALAFLADNDIPRALDLCSAFPEMGGRYYCATGVYMQRDQDLGEHDAEISPTYPCDAYDHPAACYRYKLRRMFPPTDPESAASLCRSLPEGEERHGCFHGVGFGFNQELYGDPDRVVSACASDDPLDSRMCIEGFSGVMSVYASREDVRAFCNRMEEPFASWCVIGVSVSNFGTTRDFNRYYFERENAGTSAQPQ
ncbi:MAG TPA: hypothetical protein VNM40_00955 [Candidatus Paceibacterota bacterium]|nr:hypothetical protein [Candidatus Paceibacterota bacterium]